MTNAKYFTFDGIYTTLTLNNQWDKMTYTAKRNPSEETPKITLVQGGITINTLTTWSGNDIDIGEADSLIFQEVSTGGATISNNLHFDVTLLKK